MPLINEYLSFKIAEKLNLNVPRCGLCILNEDVLVPENVAQSQFAPKTENCGVSFFSEYITRTTPVRLGLVPKLKNKEEFFKMVLFDHLIYNKDRNPGNILIKVQSGFTLYLIDHSHVFKNQCIWDQYTFLQGIRDRDYLDLTILEYNDDVYGMFWKQLGFDEQLAKSVAVAFKDILKPEAVSNILGQLPPEWSNIISKQDYLALEKYINYRASHLLDMVMVIAEERRRKKYE